MNEPRPFRLQIADHEVEGLRARLAAARWPDEINDAEWNWGTRADYLRELTHYWRERFNWRAAEAQINAFDQYLVDIDGLPLHFLHVRSPHRNAVPLLMTHGWPGSIVEFLDVIPRLTQPDRFGGRAEHAFHVTCPSLPGYGCSAAAMQPGMHPKAIALRHAELMRRLGYERYVAQGGDWGAPITALTAQVDPKHCCAIHLTLPPGRTVPGGELSVDALDAKERSWLVANQHVQTTGMGYYAMQSTRPQTLSYALHDSPLGLCAWITEKFHFWTDSERNGVRDLRNAVSWDRLLTNVSLYWFTGTIGSSMRLYREFSSALTRREFDASARIDTPMGIAVYPGEIFKTPRAWVERRWNLVHWFEAEVGGHFAAMEQPAIFATDLGRFLDAVRQK